MGEIHFALADPTNEEIVEKVKSLEPGKAAQFHLALPEKIKDILNLFKRKFYSQAQAHKIIQPEEVDVHHPPAKIIEPPEIPRNEYFWSDLVARLLSMSQGEAYWFYKTPRECRLISQKGKKFETIHEYPEKTYLFIKERLKQNMTSLDFGREARFFLEEKSTRRQGAFKLWHIDCLDKDMIEIERIPAFSQEEFIMSHPQAPNLIQELQRLFNEHRRFLIGGRERLLIKQCCYSLLKAEEHLAGFPPPFFCRKQNRYIFPRSDISIS